MAKTTRRKGVTIIDYSKELTLSIEKQILKSLKTGGKAFLSSARTLTPVDTSRLRSSESVAYDDGSVTGGDSPIGKPLPNQAIAFSNVQYALDVHDGTRRQRPKPFFRQAGKAISQFLLGVFRVNMARIKGG